MSEEQKKADKVREGERYPIVVIPCEAGGFFAEIPDLPGCMTQAESWEEIGEMIEDAKQGWLQVARDIGNPISQPQDLNVKVLRDYIAKLEEKRGIVKEELNDLCAIDGSDRIGENGLIIPGLRHYRYKDANSAIFINRLKRLLERLTPSAAGQKAADE